MKDGVRIMNVARGKLLVEDALREALDSGKVAGAALDVFRDEPVTEHPLFGYPNVVVTPHLGASTAEATDRAGYQAAEQVVAALTGGVVTSAVNVPAIAAEDIEALGPVPAARAPTSAGSRVALAEGTSVDGLEVEYLGRIAERDTRLLTVQVLKGALAGHTEEEVNDVNAPGDRRGARHRVSETSRSHARDFTDLVRVTVVSGGTARASSARPSGSRTARTCSRRGARASTSSSSTTSRSSATSTARHARARRDDARRGRHQHRLGRRRPPARSRRRTAAPDDRHRGLARPAGVVDVIAPATASRRAARSASRAGRFGRSGAFTFGACTWGSAGSWSVTPWTISLSRRRAAPPGARRSSVVRDAVGTASPAGSSSRTRPRSGRAARSRILRRRRSCEGAGPASTTLTRSPGADVAAVRRPWGALPRGGARCRGCDGRDQRRTGVRACAATRCSWPAFAALSFVHGFRRQRRAADADPGQRDPRRPRRRSGRAAPPRRQTRSETPPTPDRTRWGAGATMTLAPAACGDPRNSSREGGDRGGVELRPRPRYSSTSSAFLWVREPAGRGAPR